MNYRGYSINELAEKSTFEEVAYLLLIGKLPTSLELNEFKGKIKAKRKVHPVLKGILEKIPKEAHPMDVMRCICSFLGVLEPESKDNN